MKLSFKFFCIAYITMLISAGSGGFFLIYNTTGNMWSSRYEEVISSAKYASESFWSFYEISPGVLTEEQTLTIAEQIKNNLDKPNINLAIYFSDNCDKEYLSLKSNQGVTKFKEKDDSVIMECIIKTSAENKDYFITSFSDFTDISRQQYSLWQIYSITVLSLAVISGLILYFLTRGVTKPLNKLAMAANEIADGNYGKTVSVKSSDTEIYDLSESFNSMSLAMSEKIDKIKKETENRDIFVSNFTHELKTPMTAIIGYADMLNRYELSKEEQRQAAESILTEGKRLEKLSSQLLELFIFKNEIPEIMPVYLPEIQNQLYSTLKFSAERYTVKYDINFPKAFVNANSELLLSLLYNLADNAFKASSPNGEIKIYGISKNGKISIYVADNGCGISAEHIEMLTEPFYREDKARSRRLGGAGLGLALCKEIALLHGTELNIESEKNTGTTVSFELTLAKE